ncbi:MAG: glycosyltransferase, partial [Proteiniphilum sp.]
MHKLSVITVTWNAVTTLERTLQSVGEQSWPLLEHLVIDGGSDDGTVELIRSLSHARMKWVSEPDKGLYDAMNKGAALASGDYLCFLNAGDTFFAADTVEQMMRSWADQPA